ncbi:MAG TPA: sensor histidine kinase [Pilimelia sp.]|nr:sensor histidine kinase [Pilimelia sp.]
MLTLASLVLLWTVAVGLTLAAAPGPTAAQTYRAHTKPATQELVAQLQQERTLSAAYVGGGRAESTSLVEQRVRTDAAVASFQRLARGGPSTGAATDLVGQRLGELSAALGVLPAARETIDRGELDRPGAVRLYTRMTDAAYRLFLSLADLDDRDLARQGRAVVALGRARDVLAQEDALLAGVVAAGRLTGADHGQLVQAIGTQRARYADAAPELPEADRVAYQDVLSSEAGIRLRALEDQIVARGPDRGRVPVDLTQWRIAYDVVAARLRDVELSADAALAGRAEPDSGPSLIGLWLAGLVTVAVVVAAVWRRRPPGSATGRFGGAVAHLARTARQPALSEVRLRQGLDEVFLTIALRSQDLLHRQLALLDGLERRFTEPADLEEVFRIDHLATRMRRHVEDLITLADALPGRGWRKPVPMIDVIRGAISEVEDYARVTTLTVANAGLVGRAVGDTIHLLAELVENGTSFSPADARVEVSGSLVPNGFVIEVEDRGVGMAADVLAEANQRLAEPTGFDPTVSPCLGLYVVARLARRHGVQVRLRPSPYGGTTAIVLVPPELVAVELEEAPAGLALARRPAHAERVVELGPADVTPLDRGPANEPANEPAREPAVAAGTPGEGLPRRVPQASLAAQLRDPEGPATGEPPAASPAVAPSPERTRARLSALQTGTTRGRRRLPAPDTAAASSTVPVFGDDPAPDAGRHGQ